jgi:hypothetical protein
VTSSRCHSATRDLAVGRLDDLGGFPNCQIPDTRVGIGEGSFGGVEPGGDRGPSLYRDGGAPALVEVADGEDAVLVTSLGGGVLDFVEELWQPGRRDRGDRLTQSGQRQGGHGNQRRGLAIRSPAVGRTLLAMLRTVAGREDAGASHNPPVVGSSSTRPTAVSRE